MKQLTKNIAARIYANSRFLKVYSGLLNRMRNRHGVVIVNFHRFYDNNKPFILKGPSVHTHVDIFDKMLNLLSRRYQIISMSKLIEHLNSLEPFEKDSAVITIDDGYRDNYSLALPILKKYGIPATLYIATGFIGTNNMMPMDCVDYALRTTKKKTLKWKRITDYALHLGESSGLNEINVQIGNYIKSLPEEELTPTLSELYQILDVKPYTEDRIMLNWDEIKELIDNDVNIGSHGVSHISMTKLSIQNAINELQESKNIIFKKTGIVPEHFAFPNGATEDFSDDLRMHARNIGYSSVASVNRGINIPGVTNQYNLNRVGLIGSPEETMLYIEKLFFSEC